MSNPGRCTNVVGAVEDAAVLGIKVAGDVAKDLDKYLADALKSDEVQSEIRKALEEIARTNVGSAPITYSGEEAKRLSTALVARGASAIGQDVLSQVRKTPQYLRLRRSAEGIVSSLRCSQTGIWFDQNKKIIYILAAGLIVGGAVGMYVARAGDVVTEPAAGLVKGKKITAKPIGTLEVSAGGFKFVPSKREFQVELDASARIKQIKVEVTVTAHAIDTNVNVASAAGKVIIPFGKVVTRVEGAYDPSNMKIAPVQLGLGIEFTTKGVRFDLAGRLQFSNSRPTGGSVGIGIKGNRKGFPLSVDLGGKLDKQSPAMYFATIKGEW